MKLKKLISSVLCGAMLASTALIGVTSVTAADELPFDDVPAKWFKNAVVTVYEEGIMQGKSDTKFDPTANITRAEVVTAFARIACTNIDGKGDALTFTDTKTGKWYSDSVGWAADNGIVKGRGDGRFSPSDNITRAELASIIINFVNYMGLKLPDNPKIDKFSDAGTFANWMKEPVEAVRKTGLMQGVDGKFNPKGNATRAEIAQVIANLLPSVGRVNVVENGKTDYVIVIDEANSAAVDAAERMVWQIEETTGASIKVVDDSTKVSAKEIVLGTTDRGAKVDTADFIKDSYGIAVDGEKIYIDGSSADGLYGGAVDFMNTCTSNDDLRFTVKTAAEELFKYPVGKLTIAGNDISKYTVYYPEGSDAVITTAANDVSYYIELATGVKLPVKTGTAKDHGIIINTVASDKDFDDSFTVKSEGTNIVISGHANRGAAYGAYDFLEQYVGCRYLTAYDNYVKPADSIDITGVNYSEAPTLTYRVLHSLGYRDIGAAYANYSYIAVKNKSLRDVVWAGNNCHTFDALDNAPDGTSYSEQYENQPCLTDPVVFNVMLNNAKSWIREFTERYGKVDIISISQNDNGGYCECDNCVAEMKKYSSDPNDLEAGGTAGLMIDFVNRMSDELTKDFPDIKIHTFAYQYTEDPPVGITARDNIVVQFCPINNCYNHPFTNNCIPNRSFDDKVAVWSEIVKEIYIWDYSYQWDLDGCIYPTIGYNEVVSNYKFFAENNVSYVFNNNDYRLNNGEFIALHSYLLTKVMWNCNITEEEYYAYMQDFIQGYYGDGWESVYDAIMTVENNFDKCVCVDYKAPAQNFVNLYMKAYIDDVIALMKDARLKTATSAEFDNVDSAMVQYEWIKLDDVFLSLYNSDNPEDNQLVQDMCWELYNKFLKYGLQLLGSEPNPDPSEFTEFDRMPSQWGDWSGEMAEKRENAK